MPALTIVPPYPPSDLSTGSATQSEASEGRESEGVRSTSPDRPPVSPITPPTAVAQLATVDPIEAQTRHHVPRPPVAPPAHAHAHAHGNAPANAHIGIHPTFRRAPAPVPISESDNPDAIALRSAMMLLQMQREKSIRDMKKLADMRAAALSDVPAFARSLQTRLSQPVPKGDVLGPTLAPSSGFLTPSSDPGPSNGHGHGNGNGNGHGNGEAGWDERSTASSPGPGDSDPRFDATPQPQNIIRCPPINWAKYHIVGEPLDKMHEEQKKWPGSTEPPRTHHGTRAPPHAIASPYSPFIDGTTATRSHKATKKATS